MNQLTERNVLNSPADAAGDVNALALPAASAVSWSAIFAGGLCAAALSLILLMLGAGLGLSSVSPWVHQGLSAKAFGVSTILWVTLTQLVAAGMGGYLAGRLRTPWPDVHRDESYFRDTAHGFLAWAVASLASAVLLTSVIGSIVNAGAPAAAPALADVALTGGATTASDGGRGATGSAGGVGYVMDSLFRAAPGAAVATVAAVAPADGSTPPERAAAATLVSAKAEVARIFLHSIRTGPLPAGDMQYAAQCVAQYTGLTPQDAEKRVSDAYAGMQSKLVAAEAAAKDAANKARKASAYAALWLFISLLIGAFFASLAATFGGRQRDGR
ncbi:hypothetical protein [Pandoraea sp. PE-S2R-1]|uniref:hypothetical protein n=1 Tax=Pandoraea sp. PE-S2R-1 TaxID=1986994 RepID=UPI002016A3ED|nr:hypothetical protein [Pandoraea sp. PE-S2R-1]